MNIGGIFALFGFSDENEDDKKIKRELEAFKETPHFKIGMFIKMISQGGSFRKQLLKFFSNAIPENEMKDVDTAGEFMMYNRAWYWIKDCGVRKKEWKIALKNHASAEFLECIEVILRYFESIEEFEKCAHLKKIQDFVKKSILEKENLIP